MRVRGSDRSHVSGGRPVAKSIPSSAPSGHLLPGEKVNVNTLRIVDDAEGYLDG